MMRDLLFDTPWWLLLLLAAGGAALWFSGNARVDKTLKRVGLGVIALALILGLLSWLVDTDVETVEKNTRAMVRAVVARDQQTLRNLLHPQVNLGSWNLEDIVYAAKAEADQWGLTDVTVHSLTAEPHDTMIVVTLSATSWHDGRSILPINAIPSTWQLDWFLTDNGWRLKNLTVLKIGQTERSELDRRYFGNKPR